MNAVLKYRHFWFTSIRHK